MLEQMGEYGTFVQDRVEQREKASNSADLAFLLVCQPSTKDAVALVRHYRELVNGMATACELVVVGSGLDPEATRQICEELEPGECRALMISLHRSCGKSKALRVALDQTNAEKIVLLAATSQSRAEDVQAVINQLDDSEYVATVRQSRRVGRLRGFRTKIYNWLVGRLTGVTLRDINSGLCGVRRHAIKQLPLYGDLHLFIPVLATQRGFRVAEVEISSAREHFSDGPVSLPNYFQRMLDLFTLFFLVGFTEKPFRLFGSIGAGLAASGSMISIVLVVQRVLGQQPLGDRPVLILAILLIVTGIQLLSLGLLGELIIFVHAGATNNYHIKNVLANGAEATDSPHEESDLW
jgi:hypothetical protein